MLFVIFYNQPLRYADIMLVKETGIQIFNRQHGITGQHAAGDKQWNKELFITAPLFP
jgi:hypothetical protein